MSEQLMAVFANWGAPGLLLAFMLYDREKQSQRDKDRAAADVEMARALTLLAERIDHVR